MNGTDYLNRVSLHHVATDIFDLSKAKIYFLVSIDNDYHNHL
ncbi:hypothetical protein BACI348_50913 [Bacillus altitudinis]|uniref:Uncharacterized protein n=1 Tax=Bacillus altitudinis TaxID=293387 RepID=A0A653XU98_BACAB|nr:hypothetical protein BACI9J_60906 [Bacillus altitudinis]VXC33765.1 hypothetical protein BACI348_50913 [Bacillus altitudinis]